VTAGRRRRTEDYGSRSRTRVAGPSGVPNRVAMRAAQEDVWAATAPQARKREKRQKVRAGATLRVKTSAVMGLVTFRGRGLFLRSLPNLRPACARCNRGWR
jgi:hypothetical protein